jgi:hypothetical protein
MDKNELKFNEGDTAYQYYYKPERLKFILAMPFYKRIWRILMLIVKGWCYWD